MLHAVAEIRSHSSAITEKMRRISNAALIFLILSSGSWAQSPDNYEPIVNTGPIRAAQARPASTSIALANAAKDLPATQRNQVTQAALSIILLTKFNRLLPPTLSAQQLDHLSSIFITAEPNESNQSSEAQKLPPADTLVFDGSKLSGGNFRYIDAMIGMDGYPIALDRELPAWILPLTPSAAKGLASSQQNFGSQPPDADLAELTNRIYQANVASNLAADGIFLRPYAGRVDDLYYHLVQNTESSHLLDYFTLLDSLPPRQYSPITGTRSPQDVPPSRVNMSDILSAGSFRAIQTFRTENPRANIRNPFKGLAVRILPILSDSIHKVKPGEEWQVSRENMRRAMNDPRRFTPEKVPPMFNDPSRFLGWNDPRYIRVSKKKKPKNSLIEEIQKIDFESPLPEMTFDPTGNELLKGNDLYSNQTDVNEEDSNAALLRDLGMTSQPTMPSSQPFQTPAQQPTPAPNIPPPSPPLLFREEDNSIPNQIPEEPAATATPIPESATSPQPPTTQGKANPDITEATKIATASNPPTQTPPILPSQEPPHPATQSKAVDFIDEMPEASPSPTPASAELADATPEPQVKKAIAIAQNLQTQPNPKKPIESPPEETQPPADQPSAVDFIAEMPAERVPESRNGACLVAVLTPTAREAVAYLKKVAASDLALSENLAESKRIDCVIRWLGDLVQPFDSILSDSPQSPESEKLEPLIREARDEVVTLLKRRENLQPARIKELKDRSEARKVLENEIQTTRRDQLAKLTGIGA